MNMYAQFAIALCWFTIGSMLFFGAIVAPVVFKVLEPDDAGRFLRTLFPRLYMFCGVSSLGAAVLFAGQREFALASAIGLVSAFFFVARGPLTEAINTSRDLQLSGDVEAGKRFDRLHSLSTRIFGAQFLVLLGVALLWGPLD